jgi:phosphonate transport system substrate-binding protein
MVSDTKWRQSLFKRRRTVKRARSAAGLAVWLAVFSISGFVAAQDSVARQDAAAPIRIVLSSHSFAGLNHNDALAAILTWAKVILEQRGIVTKVEARISAGPDELFEMLGSGWADAASMSTEEFLELKAKPEFIYLAKKKNSFTERYVILVHRNSGIADVASLRGHNLLLHNSPRMSMARAWLEKLLARSSPRLPETESVGMTRIDNASRTLLPVFFRQADACLVTAGFFETASELNPQLQKELRVLASSPEVVPTVFFFRPGYSSPAKEELEAALLALHETPAGRQVLTIFQCDEMVREPITCLESSRQLRDEAHRSRHHGSN